MFFKKKEIGETHITETDTLNKILTFIPRSVLEGQVTTTQVF